MNVGDRFHVTPVGLPPNESAIDVEGINKGRKLSFAQLTRY